MNGWVHGRSPAGFLDSEPLVKGFRIASAELPSLAAVFLSSSPGDTARTLGRESKGEAFVTRSVMNTPLQAQPVARPRGCTVAEKVKHSGRRQPPDAGPRRTGTAARRAPSPAADRSDRGCQGPQAPRQGCARRLQAVPAGDEREGANLEQPDSSEAAGAPFMASPVALAFSLHYRSHPARATRDRFVRRTPAQRSTHAQRRRKLANPGVGTSKGRGKNTPAVGSRGC